MRLAAVSSRFAAWRDAHLYSLLSSLGRLAARPAATALTGGVMAIAIALPLCLALSVGELERLAGSLRESGETAVFLRSDLDAQAAEAVVARLRDDPRVRSAQLRTPEQGLAELRGMAEFGGALQVLDYNPLPYVVMLVPAAGEDAALAETLSGFADVEFVQHDAHWRPRLAAWLGLGRRLAEVAALLLGLGVLLVVGNTVRLDIQDRAAEIATVRLLGASDGFVRRPFLYLGICYGLLAGTLALALAFAVRAALAPSAATLLLSYGSDAGLAAIAPATVIGVLAGAVLLGWLGAFLAVGHHLREADRSESRT